MIVELLPIDSVRPYDKNPRRNDSAVEAVAASIREFGFKVPIVVDADKIIVTGHTRHKAAQLLGLAEVPCIIATDLSPEKIKAYRLADNKVAEIAEWDVALLEQELAELNELDAELDMSDFGFELSAVEIESIDDEFEPAFPENPISQAGDIWTLGRHRLMCGDSTKAGDVSLLLGSTKVKLTVTDPPYNVNYGDKSKYQQKRDPGRVVRNTLMNDNQPDAEFREFLLAAFRNIYNHSADGASAYVFHADTEGLNFRGAFEDAGFKVRQCLVWVKDSLVLGRQDYQWRHEPILYGWKDGAHYFTDDRTQTTVFEHDRPKRSEEHPTMKPVPLIERLIINSSKKGWTVYDPFGGSGSTLIAADRLDRAAFLMELDPKYCDVIVERYAECAANPGEISVLRDGKTHSYTELVQEVASRE